MNRRYNRLAVHGRAAAAPGGIGFRQSGHVQHAEPGPAIFHQRYRYAPALVALDKGAGAVDGINNKNKPFAQPLGVVGGLFGQPAGFGQEKRKLFLEQPVNPQVRFADRGTAVLVFHIGACLRALAEIAQGHVTGLLGRACHGRKQAGYAVRMGQCLESPQIRPRRSPVWCGPQPKVCCECTIGANAPRAA